MRQAVSPVRRRAATVGRREAVSKCLHSSMLFNNSLSANNSSFDSVTPLPIFSLSDPHPAHKWASPKSDRRSLVIIQSSNVVFGKGAPTGRRGGGGYFGSRSFQL